QLVALRAWYRAVRLSRLPPGPDGFVERAVVTAALQTLDACIDERVARLRGFLHERGATMPALELDPQVACPLPVAPADPSVAPYVDHLEWVRGLSDHEVEAGQRWLFEIAQRVLGSAGARA